MNDATNQFLNYQSLPCNVDLTGFDLNGLVLTPNVYCYSSSAILSGGGILTLVGNGGNSSIIIQIGSTLTTSSFSQVVLVNITAWYFIINK